MRTSKGKQRVLAMALAAAIAVSACNGDDDADSATSTSETTESTTSTSESTTTTDPEDELKAEVQAAHEAYWEGYLKIYGTPDPDDPLIRQLHTGQSLESALDSVSERFLAGEAIRLPEDPGNWEIRLGDVELLDERTAVVRACFVDGLVIYKTDTGEVVNDGVGTAHKTIRMLHQDSRWKLAEIHTEWQDGNPGCDDY